MIAPFGLAAVAHALSLGLEDLTFLFGFAVNSVKGYRLQSLVEKTRVFEFCGSQ